MNNDQLTEKQLDFLLLLYVHSNEHGKVNMQIIKDEARKKLNIEVPDKQLYIKQKHVDALIERGILPNTTAFLTSLKQKPVSGKKKI